MDAAIAWGFTSDREEEREEGKGSSWAHSRTCGRVLRGSRGRDGRARRLVSADRASAERARSLPGNRVSGANTWMGSRPIICHSPTTLFTQSKTYLRIMLSILEKKTSPFVLSVLYTLQINHFKFS